jgi:uncharacterized membrane protein YgcG
MPSSRKPRRPWPRILIFAALCLLIMVVVVNELPWPLLAAAWLGWGVALIALVQASQPSSGSDGIGVEGDGGGGAGEGGGGEGGGGEGGDGGDGE